MIINLGAFIVILFIVIESFASIFFLLFSDKLDNYKSIPITNRTLLAAVLGNSDFANHGLAHSLILALFLIINAIILLNLLISIISDSYNIMN